MFQWRFKGACKNIFYVLIISDRDTEIQYKYCGKQVYEKVYKNVWEPCSWKLFHRLLALLFL